MRNFEDVINQIINILGGNGFGESDLSVGLYKAIKDSRYTAPESMVGRWMEAHALLYFDLLNEDGELTDKISLDTKAEIFSIFANTSKEEVLKSLQNRK